EGCLARVRRHGTAPLVLSGLKVVVRRWPPDTVAVLFAYLPFAEDEGVAEEIRTSLAALTVKDGKPDPRLLQALESADPDRRAERAATPGAPGGRPTAPGPISPAWPRRRAPPAEPCWSRPTCSRPTARFPRWTPTARPCDRSTRCKRRSPSRGWPRVACWSP